MSESTPSLPLTYQSALREYLANSDEKTLDQAYDLGRAAMNAGLGIFDLVRLHHQALTDGVLLGDSAEEAVRFAPALESFLLEALSPFEAAYRGFRSARERLQQLNGVLAERNDELARSNAQLEAEIAVRQKVEADLRESKDHYFTLFQQAHAMEEDLRELSAKVLSAQEEERKRISRELHDEIGQALTAVNVTIAVLKKQAASNPLFEQSVADAERLLAQTLETVHAFARELRPAMLDHLGVQAALRAHLTAFTRQTGIKTTLEAHPHLKHVDGARAEALFRVAQEALTNVYKHAQATAAKVEFTSADGAIVMEISDNGRAFDVKECLGAKRTGRLGLLGMQERVRHVNGTFTIDSLAGRGTRIVVRVPFEPPPAKRAGRLQAGRPARVARPATNLDSTYEKDICAAS